MPPILRRNQLRATGKVFTTRTFTAIGSTALNYYNDLCRAQSRRSPKFKANPPSAASGPPGVICETRFYKRLPGVEFFYNGAFSEDHPMTRPAEVKVLEGTTPGTRFDQFEVGDRKSVG